MKSFKTPKGTELPLRDMRGKAYLEVAHRVLWMREEHPEWGIETEFLVLTDKLAIAKATIRDGNGRILAQGTKTETPQGFADFVEKSETGALGRALALCSYGTQFALELDEGERIVDAPREAPYSPAMPQNGSGDSSNELGAFVFKFGKYKGQRLDSIGAHDLNGYLIWLRANKKPGEEDSPAILAIDAYLDTKEKRKA